MSAFAPTFDFQTRTSNTSPENLFQGIETGMIDQLSNFNHVFSPPAGYADPAEEVFPKMANNLARLHKVLEYIDSHLDHNPDLEELSRFASLSKYHFHRQFSTRYGIGISAYVKQLRLKRAACQLAFRNVTVTDIAFTSGYESPEAFSRAFSNAVGQSPAAFRKQPDWIPWHKKQEALIQLRKKIVNEKTLKPDVNIVQFAATSVAVMEHLGSPETLGDTIRKFIQWRKNHGLPPAKSRTFNLAYNDLDCENPEEFRFGLCASVAHPVEDSDSGVVMKTIPAGRCAMLRHTGSDDTLESTVSYLYGEWLNESGEEPRDFPLFFERVTFFPDVAEHEAITDIYLPLK